MEWNKIRDMSSALSYLSMACRWDGYAIYPHICIMYIRPIDFIVVESTSVVKWAFIYYPLLEIDRILYFKTNILYSGSLYDTCFLSFLQVYWNVNKWIGYKNIYYICQFQFQKQSIVINKRRQIGMHIKFTLTNIVCIDSVFLTN